MELNGNVKPDNSIELNWSDYTGWKNGVDHYIIEKYDAQGILLQTISNGNSTTYTDNTVDPNNQIYSFIVKAVPNDVGLGEAVSNKITEIKEPNIFYPKAFTPNEDNLNDDFIVFGQYVEDFEMKIFNRWGELLFTTDKLTEGWNGKYKGTIQPEGTYAFVAKMTDLSGRSFNRSGSFVLLKKK
jgi:gliding motility-associated-like protein